jgi:hypothetical protein
MASGAAVSAYWRSIALAASVEPVKQTPAISRSATSGAPTVGLSPGRTLTVVSVFDDELAGCWFQCLRHNPYLAQIGRSCEGRHNLSRRGWRGHASERR